MTDTRARSLVSRERESLADDFLGFGPDAPTVLDDWDAQDLLQHLIVREQRPDLIVGPLVPVPPVARWADAELAKLRDLDWRQKVERFREGPGPLSPFRRLDQLMNTAEYAVHHEDLRRARPGWEPRELDEPAQRELWGTVRRFARLLVRAQVDVTLVSPYGGMRIPVRQSEGSIQVHGDPMELLLWVYGRDRVAQVRIEGSPDAIAALNRGSRGV